MPIMQSIMVETPLAIPKSKFLRIVQMNFYGNKGSVIFQNGTLIDFDETTINVLKPYKCGAEIEMVSSNASFGFSKNTKVWDDIFNETKIAHFFGSWGRDLVTFFAIKMVQLQSASFTYWHCDLPTYVIDHFGSANITEISMFVAARHLRCVVNSFRVWGMDRGGKLHRLMIVTDGFYNTSRLFEIQRDLNSIVTKDSEILILFGGEGADCIKTVEADGFVFDGNMKLATNNLYADETLFKTYGTYEVYRKCDNAGRKWTFGSVIGRVPYNEIPSSPKPVRPLLEKSDFIIVKKADEALVYPEEMQFDVMDEYFQKIQNEYGQTIAFTTERTCCIPKMLSQESDRQKLKIPGWSTTRIIKTIYSETATEFLTSTGFYLILDKMEKEELFFSEMKASERFVIVSTTSHRQFVITMNLFKFFENVKQLEFVGTWHPKTIERIISNVPRGLEQLTMIQLEIHTKRPLRFILNAVPPYTRKNLKAFHFDARATPDRCIASVINGLRSSGTYDKNGNVIVGSIRPKLEELLIIGNTFTSSRYKFKLYKHFDDLTSLLVPGGNATSIAMEDWSIAACKKANINGLRYPVVVPVAYPNRSRSDDFTRLMYAYQQNNENFSLFMVVPRKGDRTRLEIR